MRFMCEQAGRWQKYSVQCTMFSVWTNQDINDACTEQMS